jgi:tRNA nucleotidyltransferase (CCA-adding enzyme)
MQITNSTIKEAVERLAHAVPRALLVGGYVRDMIMQREGKDVDIEVYGLAAPALIEVVEKLFGRADVTGESFGVIKIMLDAEHELDISLPRRESKNGNGHKAFLVESDPLMTIEEALKRRDFTVNAIAWDPLTDEIIDPYQGQADIASRTLRVVNEKTFQEDPLRVFRGIQFAARLEFGIEEKTFLLMREMVDRGDLDHLSKERVTDEWKKLLLRAEKPSIGFAFMQTLGIIERYYPELDALHNVPQEPEWHPEGDVWIHTMMAVDEAVHVLRTSYHIFSFSFPPLIIMLGALCHDLGKPAATKKIEGRWRAFNHEELGVEPSKSFLRRFTFGHEVERMIIPIVREHLKPSALYRQFHRGEMTEQQYVNAVRRLLKRINGVPLELFLSVTEADVQGRGITKETGNYPEGRLLRDTVRRYNLEEVAQELLLTGQELIDEFGFSEGEKLGRMIARIEEARDEGEISTKDEARDLVRSYGKQ